ncbi:hypothetical protein OPQ81_000707 [Rhizoctonia solani]|nr:hypothetical protein OPQ81_000707 [Rhizoctonia solani]
MAPATLNRKQAEVAGSSDSRDVHDESDLEDTHESDSDSDDAPEAETLRGGRAAADAREGALKKHEERLRELRKTKNKAREAFIQSTKPQSLSVAEDQEDVTQTDDTGGESKGSETYEMIQKILRTSRLPDSVFAAAHESVERKRSKKPLKKDPPAKRRRVREGPAEKVVNGRTLRVMKDINAPPSIFPSTASRKSKSFVKGGSAFRRKWKKVDAVRAQVRSRTGPPRNFVTIVQ